MAGRGKTHLTGAGRGVALPSAPSLASGGARRGGREPGKPTRSTPDRVDGYHGVRALGSLKTKPNRSTIRQNVRREALLFRMEVKDRHRPAVVAVG